MLNKKKLHDIFDKIAYRKKSITRLIDGRTRKKCEVFSNGEITGFPEHTVIINTYLQIVNRLFGELYKELDK